MSTTHASPELAGRDLLRSFDPLFSSLVAISIAAHIAVAIWLRGFAPLPEAQLEEVERWIIPERSFKNVPRKAAPVVTQKKAPEQETATRPAPRARDDGQDAKDGRKAALAIISAIGRRGAVGDVFRGMGPAVDLQNALHDAHGVDVNAGAAQPEVRRGNDGARSAVDVGLLGSPGITPRQELSRAPTTVTAPANVMMEAPDMPDSPVDPKEIQRILRSRMNGIRACYENALKRNPTLHGKVVVHFVVGESGRVQSVDVESDSLGSDEVSSCIGGIIRRTRFPSSEGSIDASFPFVFLPTG